MKVKGIKIDKIADHQDLSYPRYKVLGLKNRQSYLICQQKSLLLLIEKSKRIYSKKFIRFVRSILYIKNKNFYLIETTQNCLYVKEINKKPPYMILRANPETSRGQGLKYSEQKSRVIFVRDFNGIVIFNTNTMKVERALKQTFGGMIRSLSFFGEKDDKMIFLTLDGFVALNSLIMDRKKVSSLDTRKSQNRNLIDYFKIAESGFNNEVGKTVVACPKNQRILVEMTFLDSTTSRFLVFRLRDNKLYLMLNFDARPTHQPGRRRLKYCVSLIGYREFEEADHLLFLTCVGKLNSNVMQVEIFGYNLENHTVARLNEFDEKFDEPVPTSIERFQQKFYFVCENFCIYEVRIL